MRKYSITALNMKKIRIDRPIFDNNNNNNRVNYFNGAYYYNGANYFCQGYVVEFTS